MLNKFTLIELLVVIAVIALLVSLLLPALSSAKARGKEIACSSNLRQNSMAMHMYAADYSDTMVIFLYRPGNMYQPGYSARWLELLNGSWGPEYLKSNKGTLCSSMEPEKYINTSYVYGAVISAVGPGVFNPPAYIAAGGSGLMITVSRVPAPSSLPILGDSVSYSSILLKFSQIYSIQKSPAANTVGGLHLRHFNGANLAFLDGHVKNVKRSEARESLSFVKGYLSSCDFIDF